jgi:arylsulfatase A-like enzyme
MADVRVSGGAAEQGRLGWYSDRATDFPVVFAATWLVAALVRALMFGLLAGTPMPMPALALFERIGLVGYQFVVNVPVVVITALAATLLVRRGMRRNWPVMVATSIAVVLALALEIVRFSGWATFYSTDQFPTAESWLLFSSAGSQLVAHVVQGEAWVLVAVPTAAILALVLTVAACRAALGWSPRRRRLLVGSVGLTLGVSLLAAWSANILSAEDDARIVTRPHQPEKTAHDAWVAAAKESSGPIARLIAELIDEIQNRTADLRLWKSGPTIRRRVISLGEYAARNDGRVPHRWNVVFIVVESMRADALVADGGRRLVMPALESIAGEATVYSDALAQATQSDYSTTSTLSSQYPLRTPRYRTFSDPIPYPRVLLYDVLRARGWRTGVFSSQNENWAGMYSFLNTGGVEHFLHAETYSGETHAQPEDFGFWNWVKAAKERAGKIDDAETMTEAIAWIDSIGPARPFFAYFNLQSSHTPYVRPESFPPRFGSGRVSFPIRFGGYNADSVSAVRDMYDNSLAYVDAQIGRLVGALKRSGRWDSTLVVVSSDHGEAFFEHGFAAHGNKLYREVTHVPLVVRVPGRASAHDSLPAAAIDIVPTVLSLLALPPHPAFQGVDLADTTVRRHRPVFSLSQTALADEVAVEQDGWCLHYDLRHAQQNLFDLRTDPNERVDVGTANIARRNAMADLVAEWWNSQLGYYGTLRAKPRFYPPVIVTPTPEERHRPE